MKTFEEDLPDLIDDMHICENEGHGCEIEKYSAYDREYYRCRLRRESLEAIFAAHQAEMDRVVEVLREEYGKTDPNKSKSFSAGYDSALAAVAYKLDINLHPVSTYESDMYDEIM